MEGFGAPIPDWIGDPVEEAALADPPSAWEDRPTPRSSGRNGPENRAEQRTYLSPLDYALFWFSSAALLLLPGALLAWLFPALGPRLSPGERVLPAALLSAGYLGLVWSVSLAIRPTIEFALGVWLGGTVVLGILALFSHRRRGKRVFPRLEAASGKGAVLLTCIFILLAEVAVFREGGSLGYIHDSLDFVAFVRRMLESGRIDLVSAAYADTEALGADPRRGAFHLGMALVCLSSGVDPVTMWRVLPTFLVPLALWIFFVTTRRLFGSGVIGAAAVFFLAGIKIFESEGFLLNLAYASRLGWVYSWIGIWAVALFLDAERTDKSPPSDWTEWNPSKRLASRAVVGLAVAGAPILVGVHVLSAVQYLVGLGAFCWTWMFSRREPRPVRRWLLLLPLLGAAALLPALLIKMAGSYSAENPIFDHPQGLLYLWDGAAVLAPGHLSAWLGWPGLLGILLVIPLAPRMLEQRGFAYLVGSTVVAALILLNPLAVGVIEKAKAHSVLFRVLLIVPFFQTLGLYLVWAIRRLRDERTWRRWVLPVLFLLLTATISTLHMRQAIAFFQVPEHRRGPWLESQPLLRALEFLHESEAEPQVVVADPMTSYQIPAYTRHYAIAPFNQHSSPADDRAVERIYDVQAVLSPYVSAERTDDILSRYEADFVLLNHSYPRYVKFYYTYIETQVFPEERAKFERRPDHFERIYDREGIVIFRVLHPAPTATLGAEPETRTPFQVLSAAEAAGQSAEVLARRLGIDPVILPPVGGLELIGVVWDTTRFVTGDYVKVKSYWRRNGPPMVLPVEAFFRLEAQFPNDHFLNPWYGKPYRRYFEKTNGVTYRFGRMHAPLEGIFPPPLWDEGAVYWSEYALPIPRHAVPGEYEVGVKLMELPYSPNYRLTDYLRVRDSLEGTPIRTITIATG